jgi:hypothetical protein
VSRYYGRRPPWPDTPWARRIVAFQRVCSLIAALALGTVVVLWLGFTLHLVLTGG